MISGIDPRALRAARERAGLTQSELARRIGVVGGERVSRWELGRSQPRPDLLVRMAEELDLRPRQLVMPASSVPDLRALRLAAGLDAYEVVEAIHLSLPTYRKWEQGRWRRLPAKGTLATLARTFMVSLSEVERAFHAARRQLRERAAPDED
ncbi:MAG: helix-turn-helix transcriptional regulator [Nocardioides sp.]